MDLFLLKKIISFLIMPLSIIILLMLVSLICFKRKPKLSFICLLLSTLMLTGSSIGWIADKFIHPLENEFDSFTRSSKPIDYIVILGCGHASDDSLPATQQLFDCSLQRLVEAVRIYSLHPEAQIISSGAAFSNNESNAEKVKQAAILLGIPTDKIIVESFPKDTEEESELISSRVMGKQVVLITNADHMLRSVKYFQQQGVKVIPAPASKMARGLSQEKNWGYYIPNSQNLTKTTRAWYEAIGLFVQWLKSL